MKDEQKRKVKRINRIKSTDKIICNMIEEDLIDLFDSLEEAGVVAQHAEEELNELGRNEETCKKAILTEHDFDIKRIRFWDAVQERYGYWTKSLGMRDGYCLVICNSKSEKTEQDDMKAKLDKMMKKIIRDVAGGDEDIVNKFFDK